MLHIIDGGFHSTLETVSHNALDLYKCNRLPVLRQNTTICLTYVLPCLSCLDLFQLPGPPTSCCLYLPHVFIPLDFHRFRIKLLSQFPYTVKLTHLLLK